MDSTVDSSGHWEVRDRYGNKVYMTRERWEHVLERRPWLDDLRAEVVDTVRRGRRKQDPLDSAKYKYYRSCRDLLPEYNHLVVVVRFGERIDERQQVVANNYVLTAWPVFIYGKR